MSIQWKKLLIAGASGLACGKVYTLYRRDEPRSLRPILHCTLLGGATGVAVGLGVASYRRLPSHVYALSVGANFAITTGIFLSLRHLLIFSSSSSSQQHQLLDLQGAGTTAHTVQTLNFDPATAGTLYMSSAVSGALTGTLASLLSRHAVKVVVLTGFGGVCVGIAGQYLYDKFEIWRKNKAIEIHYPELADPSTKADWSLERLQTRFMAFWNQSSKTAEVSADIDVLKRAIAGEEAEVARLNLLLKEEEELANSRGSDSSHNTTTQLERRH